MDKNLIATRFSKANNSYTDSAIAQKIIHNNMLRILIDFYKRYSFESVLEIGCGNGCFTKLIEQNCGIASWTINDLVDYINLDNIFDNRNPKSVNTLFGDAETIDFFGKYDLITSSCVIQWFHNPIEFIKRITKNLNPNGILLFSSFGEKNLCEIKNLTNFGLKYTSSKEYKECLNNFDINVEETEITLQFDTPYDVLKHLKNTGVTATSSETFCWNKQKLRDFEKRYYDLYSTNDNKVLLTYHPIYIYLRNR